MIKNISLLFKCPKCGAVLYAKGSEIQPLGINVNKDVPGHFLVNRKERIKVLCPEQKFGG